MKTVIKAIIIDDEPYSIRLLKDMLSFCAAEVEVIGTARSAQTGIQLLQLKQPDLVFLDVEMPGGNGFTLLDQCQNIPIQVIFVTGYDQYAIQAIKYAALDYLLKPVDLVELEAACKKAIHRPRLIHQQVQVLKEHMSQQTDASELLPNQIVLPQHSGYIVIQLSELIHIQADGSYTTCYLLGGKKQTSTHSLQYFEDLLDSQEQFFRIHKSHLINCQFVHHYDKGRGGKVYLKNGKSLPLATRRKPSFIKTLQQIKAAPI